MKITITKNLMAAALTVAIGCNVQAQSCTFNGLNPAYCLNSPSTALTTTASGGFFFGNGVAGSAFVPTLAGVGTHTVAYGTCTGSYAVNQNTTSFSTYSYVAPGGISSENNVYLGDDQVTAGLPIGFAFNFFCNNYTTFYISSNAFVTFNGGAGNGCCSGIAIPNGSQPNDIIATSWEDWNPGAGGAISYTTIGAVPFRTLVVTYSNVPHYGGSGGALTSQIHLIETYNIVRIITQSMISDGGNHTHGIENSTGTNGYYVSSARNGASYNLANDFTEFVPVYSACQVQTTVVSPTLVPVSGNTVICSGGNTSLTASGAVSYTWSGGVSSNAALVNVNPSATTVYSVASTNSIGCIATRVVTVVVNPGLPSLTVTASQNSVCVGKTVTLTAAGANSYVWSNGIANGGTVMPVTNTVYVVTGSNACGSSTAAVSITATPLPVVAVSNPTLSCAGQASTLTAVAAATGFSWTSNTSTLVQTGSSVIVNPQSTTVYTVAASDGTCGGVATLTLNVNPVPTLAVVANTTSICQGQSATLTVNGANTYSWMPTGGTATMITVSPMSSILYTVEGTNGFGCKTTTTQIMLVKPSPTIGLTASSTLACNGGTVDIFATGANAYAWSNGASGSSANYTINSSGPVSVSGTNTSNGCVSTSSMLINAFTPSISVTGPTLVCSGSNATLTGIGDPNGGTTFSWVGGFGSSNELNITPTVSGTYTLSTSTQTDNGLFCEMTVLHSVSVAPLPAVNASSTRTVICSKVESTTLTASGASSYLWSSTSGTVSTASAITVTAPAATTLNYTVTGKDANGCENTSYISVKVNACTGIDNAVEEGVMVYPNPNNGDFVIRTEKPMELTVVNALGQVVRNVTTEPGKTTVSVSGLANGVYFVVDRKGNVNTKVIVNR
jgi:hypothetical protein